VVAPWASLLTGATTALIFHHGEKLLLRWGVDDPLSAFPMHGCCGAWALLAVGLFAQEDLMLQVYGIPPGGHRMGLLFGGNGKLFLTQVRSGASAPPSVAAAPRTPCCS
jgi:ammonium transporter, Amt family